MLAEFSGDQLCPTPPVCPLRHCRLVGRKFVLNANSLLETHSYNFAPETLGFMGFLRVSLMIYGIYLYLFGIYGMKLTVRT